MVLDAPRLKLEARRVANDEKRFEIEAEEWKGLIEERKHVIGILSALVKELG